MALEKDKAAAFLGCSERQIERYVKDNRLSVTYEREAGRTRPKPMFDESELQRLKTEIEAPVTKPIVSPYGAQNQVPTNNDGVLSALVAIGNGANENAFLALLNHVAHRSAQEAVEAASEAKRAPGAQELAVKLFLTVSEAAQLAGVGKSAIEAAIKAGYLKAHNGLGRGRRVKRADVERWAKAL